MKLHENKLKIVKNTVSKKSHDRHYNDVNIRESHMLCFTSRNIIAESQKAILAAQERLGNRDVSISATA